MNCIDLYIAKFLRSVIIDKDTGKCKYYFIYLKNKVVYM